MPPFRRTSIPASSSGATDALASRTCQRLAVMAGVILALLAAPRLASAQSAEAETLFRQGKKQLAEGKIAEACDTLEASNRVEPRAGTLILLGECREKNDQLASAWSAFADAKIRAKDPAKRQFAERRAAALEPRLSYLTVSVPDESRVEGLVITRDGEVVDRGLWNRAMPVDGRKYHIVGKAPGHEAWATDIVVPMEQGSATIDVPKFKVLVTPVGEPAQHDPYFLTDVPPSPSPLTTRRWVAIGIGAAGVGAIITGAVFGVSKNDLETRAHSACPDPANCTQAAQANDLLRQAQDKALAANIAYGAGGALAVGAVVLWVLSGPPGAAATDDETDDQADADAAQAARLHIQPRFSTAYVGLDLSLGF